MIPKVHHQEDFLCAW